MGLGEMQGIEQEEESEKTKSHGYAEMNQC